ncbi:MAG: hypothetical protein DRP08_03485 [Candidatus Aenigmatarchaeota archaeon]|nr:MAG: hypothetical protein DRP08_03485 [Candidatus Aenigmarchaeota archaeon]
MTDERKKLLRAYRYALAYEPTKMSRLAGQGFTEYECLECEGTFMHGNTNTPIFCNECREKITKILADMFQKGEL